jgi:hypothetical protein
MKTAVEHAQEIINIILYYLDDEELQRVNDVFEQAKAMEKEQIIDAYWDGVRYDSGSVMATERGEDTEEYNFEQHYNETFK